MKKSYKVMLLICVIGIAIVIVLISSIKQRKENNTVANTNNTSNTIKNNIGNGNNDEVPSVVITYQATSEVFRINGTEHTITVFQDFPTVRADKESVKNKIQETLGKIANEEFNEYKKEVENSINDKYGIDASDMERTGDLTVKWNFYTDRSDKKVISVKSIGSGNLGGAVWDEKRGYSFDTETGDLLTLDSIAIHAEACKKYIKDDTIKYLRANYKNIGMNDQALNNLNEIVNLDEVTWYFSNTGLTLCFEQYKLVPGAFEYTIEYNKLVDLVKPEYLK